MERLAGKRIVVTGGAGFIGSHLVNDLLAQKNSVAVIDDLSSGKKEYLHPKVVLYQADVRDKKISEIFEKENPEIVFHLAAKAIVQQAYDQPFEAIQTNVMGTVNVLEICRQRGNVTSIVVVSSDKAYGKAKKLPYQETSPLQGDHPYDASKSAADLIARTYAITYGSPVAITRFSNVFGPGDTNFSRLIPGAMRSIINHEPLLLRSDGTMVREYTYVKDISAGCVALANKTEKYKGQAFNFGSHNIFSVTQTIKKIETILGKKIDYKILNTANNEIPAQYLDWSKAKEKLTWEPNTSFEKGIKETFAWYQHHYFKK